MSKELTVEDFEKLSELLPPSCPTCGNLMSPWYGCKECKRYACHECKKFLEVANEGYVWSEEKQLFIEKPKEELCNGIQTS